MIRKTLPDCFRSKYPRTTCIIDCSEVFIERATSFAARSDTYFNYKSHNTAKFSVAISPTGQSFLFPNVEEDMHQIN